MRVLIIDDDQLVTMSLNTILSATENVVIVGTGNSGKEAITLFEERRPDILLMDIQMGDMTGLVAAKQILAGFPEAKIVFLTTFLHDDYLKKSFEIGAKGYILKQDFSSIVASLQAVMEGQSVYGEKIISRLPTLIRNDDTILNNEGLFTEREFAILTEISEGLSNREIAEKLFLSEGTVRNYISALLEKLELRDRTQLAIYYYKNKLFNQRLIN